MTCTDHRQGTTIDDSTRGDSHSEHRNGCQKKEEDLAGYVVFHQNVTHTCFRGHTKIDTVDPD